MLTLALSKRFSIAPLVSILCLALGACGGGGGGGGGPAAGSSASGTSAKGAPVAGAVLTLKDAAGTSRTATTGADGAYSIDTTGLTPPFFVKVVPSAGNALYSVSANAGASTTINVTPLTDLIIRSWYNVQGVSVDTGFGAPASYPAPSPTQVQIIATVVQNLVQLWLDQAGVPTTDFNLISTPFSADHTGVDLVLDRTTVNTGTGALTITDGTTTQNSTLTPDTGTGAITASTTTTGTTGSSTSTTTTVVPVQTAQQQALDGITASLTSFAAVINAKGASLQAADVLPFLDPNLLNGGRNQAQFAANVVSAFGSGVVVVFTVQQIKSLDVGNSVADVLFRARETLNGQTQNENIEFNFRKVGSAWLLSGDGRIAQVELQAEMRTESGPPAGLNGPTINVDVQPPVGSVSGVTVTGGSIWNGAALTKGATIVDPNGDLDHYTLNTGVLASLVPAGTPFTFTLATAGGPVSYTLKSNSFTNEAIAITSPTGHTVADATLGSPLNVTWTLPKTFPVGKVHIGVTTFTGDQTNPATKACQFDNPPNSPLLGTTATTGQVIVPPTCANLAVVQVNLNLNVDGVNGERENATYFFK